MSRIHKAIEERHRKQSQIFERHRVSQDNLRLAREQTEKRLAEEEFEKTRPCTLNDINGYFNEYRIGRWYFSHERPDWQIERDNIISVARKKAENIYVRPANYPMWQIDPNWENIFKDEAVKEWKLRQTKLYKALK